MESQAGAFEHKATRMADSGNFDALMTAVCDRTGYCGSVVDDEPARVTHFDSRQRRCRGGSVRRDLARLNLIRRCRDCDMPLERIAELIALSEGARPCAETVAFFRTQREVIQARIAALQELDFSLGLYVQGCESGCLPSDRPCDIYDDLQGAQT